MRTRMAVQLAICALVVGVSGAVGFASAHIATTRNPPTRLVTHRSSDVSTSTVKLIEEQGTIWGTSENPFDGAKPKAITWAELRNVSLPFKIAVNDAMLQPAEILVLDGVVVFTYPDRHEAIVQYPGHWSNAMAKGYFEYDLANMENTEVKLVELAGGQLGVSTSAKRSEVTLGNDTTLVVVRRYVTGPPPIELAKGASAALVAQAPPGTGCCGPTPRKSEGTLATPTDVDRFPENRKAPSGPALGIDPLPPDQIKFPSAPDNSPGKGERLRLSSTTVAGNPVG